MHELKTWPIYFDPIASGAKRFELRREDRGFKVGDVLKLREYRPATEAYTGRTLWAKVTYVASAMSCAVPALQPGYAALSIDVIGGNGL